MEYKPLTNEVCQCHPVDRIKKMKNSLHLNYNTTNQHRKTIRHYNVPCHAHFLTFSCYQCFPLLSKDRTRNWLIESIITAKEKYQYALWAYVIMPEHAHLLVYPLIENYNISQFLKAVKQSVARRAKHYLEENDREWLDKLTVKQGSNAVFRFWQAGPGYDRNITSKDELFEKIHYMHRNPVRRGLAQIPEEWEWSSASWYNGEKNVVLAVDEMNL